MATLPGGRKEHQHSCPIAGRTRSHHRADCLALSKPVASYCPDDLIGSNFHGCDECGTGCSWSAPFVMVMTDRGSALRRTHDFETRIPRETPGRNRRGGDALSASYAQGKHSGVVKAECDDLPLLRHHSPLFRCVLE
ncbi:hypothetical protein MRX96_056128 [Rhipicephalus microplus]